MLPVTQLGFFSAKNAVLQLLTHAETEMQGE